MSDQACPPTKVCTHWICEHAPLVKKGRYWCCPKCDASYGETAPHPDLGVIGHSHVHAGAPPVPWYRCRKCGAEYGDAKEIPPEHRACIMVKCDGRAVRVLSLDEKREIARQKRFAPECGAEIPDRYASGGVGGVRICERKVAPGLDRCKRHAR
jgi:hypothetical protein